MQSHELKAMAQRYFETARKIVLDGEELTRMFFVQVGDDMHVVAAPCSGHEEDAAMVKILRLMFAVWGADSYCMVSEIWVSENPRYSPRASEDPDRTEAIMLMTMQRVRGESGETQDIASVARAKITRDPVAVGELEWDEGARVGGRFADLLPPPDAPKCPDNMKAEILAALAKAVGNIGGRLEEFRETVH